MSTTYDVPVPDGATAEDDWQNGTPQPYRTLFGEVRTVDGIHVDRVSVQVTALQFRDGQLDDGSVYEPPHVYLGDEALSTGQARALAAVLISAADEADRWAAK